MNDQLDAVAKEDAADEAEFDENTVTAIPGSEAQANVKDVVQDVVSSGDDADGTAVASMLDNAPIEGVEAIAEEEVVDEGEAEMVMQWPPHWKIRTDVGVETVVEEEVVDEGEADDGDGCLLTGRYAGCRHRDWWWKRKLSTKAKQRW